MKTTSLHLKGNLLLFLIFMSIAAYCQTHKTWKLNTVGVRFQVVDQYLPDLDYLGIISFANSQDAALVDMSDFENYGTYEFYSQSIGMYLGATKSITRSFSHYVEAGVDFHTASEFLVDYYTGDLGNLDYYNYGWCVVQDGLNVHLRYALNYQWKFIEARLGPTFTYGTSFNGELLLLTYNFDFDQPISEEENFGQVSATRSWVAYADAQLAFRMFKGLHVVLQGKLGTGRVSGLDEQVKHSEVFGIGLEYQYKP